MAQACAEAGWGPELEVCLPGTQDRPADVLLHKQGVTPLAIDVTVSHPLRPSSNLATIPEAGTEAARLEQDKNGRYLGLCRDAGWRFHPLGFETTGGVGPHCRRFFRQLVNQICLRSGERLWEVSRRMSHHLTAALAKGRARMLLSSGIEGGGHATHGEEAGAQPQEANPLQAQPNQIWQCPPGFPADCFRELMEVGGGRAPPSAAMEC